MNPNRMPKLGQSDHAPIKVGIIGIFKPTEPHNLWDACIISFLFYAPCNLTETDEYQQR